MDDKFDALNGFYYNKNNNQNMDSQQLSFLCSSAGITHIKNLLLREYPEAVVNMLDIKVTLRASQAKPTQNMQNRTFTQSTTPGNLQKIPEILLRQGSPTQDWIKRVLHYLFTKGYVHQDEIERLHDLDYSKDTFGIAYPLLADKYEDTIDSQGHCRYWSTWKLLNKYFVCSQWWKQLTAVYEQNIYMWIKKVLKI